MNTKILALDLSLTCTGWAVLEDKENKAVLCEAGKIQVPDKELKLPLNDRVWNILRNIDMVMGVMGVYNHDSDIVLEDGFIGRGAGSSMKIAHLRGAVCGDYMSHGYNIYMYEPSAIRKAVGLGGEAKKEDVADAMIKAYPFMLKKYGPFSDKKNKNKTSDIYDAAAIGLAHFNIRKQEANGNTQH